MFNVIILVILIIIVLCIGITKNNIFENFTSKIFSNVQNTPFKTPFETPIQTPMSNYLEITKNIDDQQKYKSNLVVGLSPTPTIQCSNSKSQADCVDNGCNWFGTYCSSMYPSYL